MVGGWRRPPARFLYGPAKGALLLCKIDVPKNSKNLAKLFTSAKGFKNTHENSLLRKYWPPVRKSTAK